VLKATRRSWNSNCLFLELQKIQTRFISQLMTCWSFPYWKISNHIDASVIQENVDIDFINWKLTLADIETHYVGTGTDASTVVKRDDDEMRSKQKNAPILGDIYMIKNDNGLPSVQQDYKLKRLARSCLRCSSLKYKIAALDVPIEIFLRMSRCFCIYVLWKIIERQLYVWEEKKILLLAIQSTW
jgi:hypothetical protein